jgi:hypothetical protein
MMPSDRTAVASTGFEFIEIAGKGKAKYDSEVWPPNPDWFDGRFE